MKLAVIKTGGKQYVVRENDVVKVEKLEAEVGAKIQLETLLVVDGEKLEIGKPILNTVVEGTVYGHGRDKKVTGIKFKSKTRQSTKFGHRQHFTKVTINKI